MRHMRIVLILFCAFMSLYSINAAEKNTRPLVKLETLSQKVVINSEQMDINQLLNVIRNNTDSKIILAPEFSGVQDLKRIIALPKGVITLRELLDVICIQLEAKWIAGGEQGEIIINPLHNTIITPSHKEQAPKGLYTVDYAGKSLRRVLADLHKRSGVTIIMYGNVANIKIEVMMADATVQRILEHIADMYNLRLTLTGDGAFRIGR